MYIIQIKRFAVRIVLVLVFTAAILVTRMASGTPKFKPVDNPASFSNSSITRVCLWKVSVICITALTIVMLQVLSYSYVYSLNCWLLLNPSWLCFDWSMGCVPLLHSITDYRFIAVIAFWLAFAAFSVFSFLGRKTYYKRYTMIIILLKLIRDILIGLL